MHVQPKLVTASEATVMAHVTWAHRGGTPFLEGVASTGRARAVGFSSEVILVRGQDGRWSS